MKRTATILALSLLAVLLMAAAVLPKSELQLFLLLNGKPTKLGVLTSTGTSVTNATTAVPFTVTAQTILKVECDAQAYVGLQGTCHGTVTNANYCPLIDIRPARETFLVPEGVTVMSAISVSGTANCMVWQMY